MFLRVVKTRSGSEGQEREYVRFVESYRDDNGRPRQRVVANLGRKEVLAEHLDALIGIVRGEPKVAEQAGEVAEAQAWDWGPMLVARHLWTEHRALDKKLKAAQLDLSATDALRALRTVRVVDLHLAGGAVRRIVTRGSPRAAQILKAVGVTDRNPPVPHPDNQTVS